MTDTDLMARLDAVLGRLERLLPATQPPSPIDWTQTPAARFVPGGAWRPLVRPARVRMDELQWVDRQRDALMANTAQFVAGVPANNVLLTGARGTGKSSLVKACLAAFAAQGLRLIEVDKADLAHLPDIVDAVAALPQRFIVYCDDLSFDAGERGYQALKSVLDGSLAEAADNVLIYATSNRRHLMPEQMQDNLAARPGDDGEIHPGEAVEEKISLSERFGLWLAFYPFSQAEYLDIVAGWLRHFGHTPEQVAAAEREALQFALQRGSRSGRVAWQYARDRAGRTALARP
ncbi:MAG: ATP-binding protein [Proteobacteria bacterium]|nr:ATP-binding protein [Pseudomonadota bacterium]